MKVLTVSCNHCGAPLEVPAKTRFLTCSYCSARLEVHRSDSAVYTEVLEAIDQRTQKIADDVAYLKLQSDLEQLDRQWVGQRAEHVVRDKHGRESIPTTGGIVVGAGVAAAFGIFWTIMAATITHGSPFPVVGVVFPLFGVVFVIVAIVMGISGFQKAESYQRERSRFEAQRQKVLREMRAMEEQTKET